ncbi:hypothetical protein KA977_04005, partial [Candidatus Dependentiae bacterium]|nr:hypothetical protein [Candidatus Dependentiae bacterium]
MNGNAVKFGDNTYPAKIWDLIIDGCICINNTFSIDTETTLIEPGQTPDYVIGTCFNGKTVYLLKRESVSEFVELHKNCIWFFHNAAFDIAVIERLTNFRFYKLIENHRIIDTAILYRLIRIAKAGHPNGQYNLGYLSFEYLDIELPKKELDEEGNEIRKNFGKFLNSDLTVDYERIPEQYYQYALLDAIATYFLAEKLIFEADDIIKKFKLPTRFGLLTHQIQLMGDYALYKISQNGMCIDTELVDNVCNELQQHQQEYLKILNTYEYYPKQKNNKKVLDKILRNIEITHSIFLPNTVSGKYKSAKEDILKEYTHLNFIYEYIEYHKCNKLINTFLNKFNIKKVYPNYRLIVATGRTSCSKPNVQNLPRKGRTREVFIPTEGYLLLAVDYSQIELITLALIIFKKFGSSK